MDFLTIQYEEFKALINKHKQVRQDLYLIAGAPASGKSWICNQLKHKYNYISFDGVNKNYHIYELLINNDKPLLYDPTFKVSTFIKRYGHLFKIHKIIIRESQSTIEKRMLKRDGKITNTIQKRIKRMETLSKDAEFIGTSHEVLDYLK